MSLATQAKGNFLPNSFQANYETRYKSIYSGKMKKIPGKMEYLYPGRFSLLGKAATIVRNPQKTWYYTPPGLEGEEGQLTITTTRPGDIFSLFDMIRNGLHSNKNFKVKKNKNIAELTFSKELQKELNLIKATLYFKNSIRFMDLIKIELNEASGKNKAYYFSKIDTSKKFKKSHFIFTPPKKTRITQ